MTDHRPPSPHPWHLRAPRRRILQGLAATGAAALALGRAPMALASTTVTFVGWQGYDSPFEVGGFPAANGITLQPTYVNTLIELMAKLRAGALGTIDIVTPEVSVIELMVRQGLLAPIDEAKITNLPRVHPFLAGQPMLRRDGVLYAVPFTFGALPLLYRPDLVVEPPTSWMDVLRPEYKGKVVMIGGILGNIHVWGQIVTGANPPTLMTPAQLTEVVDFLIRMKKEHARVVASSFGEMADILARGDAVISSLGWEPVVGWAQAKGAQVAMTIPKEGTSGFIDLYAVCTDAPNRDLSHLLIDHALSIEPQTMLAVDFGQGIANLDAIAALPEDKRAIYPYDTLGQEGTNIYFHPFPPIEDDGVHATWEMMVAEFERFNKA